MAFQRQSTEQILFNRSQAANALGVTHGSLRNWEQEHGGPFVPGRGPHGVFYHRVQVEMMALVLRGELDDGDAAVEWAARRTLLRPVASTGARHA